MDKFATNVARDARNAAALQTMGWRGATVWECETRNPVSLAEALRQLVGPESKRRPAGPPSRSEEADS